MIYIGKMKIKSRSFFCDVNTRLLVLHIDFQVTKTLQQYTS